MTVHYTVLAEVDRQRREQVTASLRRPAQLRRRWWHRDHLRHPMTHPVTHPVAAATA
jgi:hypothetical protein